MIGISKDPVVYFRTVGISLTMKCNFKCAHCITDSSPATTDEMDEEDAINLVEEISKESDFICFTGGECLLKKDLLLKCMKKASEKGMIITLVTNGFWAKDDDATVETLRELKECGLEGICISLDKFHVPFVSPQNAIRITQKCKELNLRSVIRICTVNGDDFPDKLMEENKDKDIKFQVVKILRLGRAETLPVEMFNYHEDFPDGSCTTVLSPIVLPSGVVQACCGPGIDFCSSNPLNLGNWKNENLSDILRKSRVSPLVMALHNIGPTALLNMIEKRLNLKHIKKRDKYSGICELCIDMCNDAEIVEAMEKAFEDEEVKTMLIAGQIYQQSCRYLYKGGFLELPGEK